MLVVGELINASRKAIGAAIRNEDSQTIQKTARDQLEAGADFIDVNAGGFVGQEAEYLQWLVKLVQTEDDSACCCIDSSDPKAIQSALSVHKGTAMINSISLESSRYDDLLPLLAGTDLKVIALCMSDDGMPETTDQRLQIADKLINGLVQQKVKADNIYVDPLVQPIATDKEFGTEFLNSIDAITKEFESVHTICGLSNISYGLPNRKFINHAFAVMAIAKGIDGLIIDPLDQRMMANIITAEALAGKDNYCMNYLKAHRAGKIDF